MHTHVSGELQFAQHHWRCRYLCQRMSCFFYLTVLSLSRLKNHLWFNYTGWLYKAACSDVIDLSAWSCSCVRIWIRTWHSSRPARCLNSRWICESRGLETDSLLKRVNEAGISWFEAAFEIHTDVLLQFELKNETIFPLASRWCLDTQCLKYLLGLCPGPGHRRQPRHPGRVHRGGEDDGSVVEAAVSGGHGGRSVPHRNRPAGQDEGVHAGTSKLKRLSPPLLSDLFHK